MINFVVKNGEDVYVQPAKGFTPENAIGIAPENIAREDWPYLQAIEAINEFGENYWNITIDQDAKAQALAAKSKQDQIEAAYNAMVKDIYDELYKVFRTRQPETATAEKETWDDMLINAANYASLGLKVDHQLNNADGSELFSPGSALDTAQKIVAYATRKLEQVRAYGPYRMQRKQQFYDERATILGS